MKVRKKIEPTKAVIKPNVPMKSLFWDHIVLPPLETVKGVSIYNLPFMLLLPFFTFISFILSFLMSLAAKYLVHGSECSGRLF